MSRFFNTAGPCNPDDHYMLSPMRRLPQVRRLIDQKAYFVLHAPRQSGKSTALLALARDLTREGRYIGAFLDMKVGSNAPGDPGVAEEAILDQWRSLTIAFLPAALQPPPWPMAPERRRIGAALAAWAQAAPRPLVVFLDEADSLRDTTLLALLDQLRSGHPARPTGFPWSLALIGLRDIRDYRIGEGHLGTSSPFNIKVESITLRDFTAEEVAELYQQHTDDTGQRFTPEAVARAFYFTRGQPWLVNALARQLVETIKPDPAQEIGAADVDLAKEILIQRQDTHLDSLAERLREPRVRHIIEPILAGGALGDVAEDDIRFLLDLGLIREAGAGIEIANPIYREIIPRVLSRAAQASVPRLTPSWLNAAGVLEPERLLEAFLAFWRQHGQPLMGAAAYHEIAPHLVLMAFLQRVVNGGGTVEREFAIGSRRMDLCVRYGAVTLAIELKVWRDGERDPSGEGLAQIDRYLAGLTDATGWLVIFDRRSGQGELADRTTVEPGTTPSGRVVQVIRA